MSGLNTNPVTAKTVSSANAGDPWSQLQNDAKNLYYFLQVYKRDPDFQVPPFAINAVHNDLANWSPPFPLSDQMKDALRILGNIQKGDWTEVNALMNDLAGI